jgi:hypothetical protein
MLQALHEKALCQQQFNRTYPLVQVMFKDAPQVNRDLADHAVQRFGDLRRAVVYLNELC